jgi:hypothetical protein
MIERRVDWESEPRSPSVRRILTAGLLVAILSLLAFVAVYESTGGATTSMIVFFGGMFPAYALCQAAQRFYFERGFARLLSER